MVSYREIFSNLERKYEQAYGFAIFDLDLMESADKIEIRGKVLTENQRAEVVSEIRKIGEKQIEENIQILSDIKSGQIGWAVVKTDLVDIKSRFVKSVLLNDKIKKRIQSSQIKKGEILRIIFKKENQVLVQTTDLTMGWVNRADVVLKRKSLRKSWRKGIFAEPDKLIFVKNPLENIILEAEKFLGVKYILGANSEKGIDCSGLTQLVYKNAFNIILPRHSWDQKKKGVSINLEKAQTGDLIFMTNKKTDIKHTGILEVLADNTKNIIHSSIGSNGVARQSFNKVVSDYNILEIRRIAQAT